MRPETRYAGGIDSLAGEAAPARSGIWFTEGADGSDLRMIDHSGKASHFNRRDPRTLILGTEHPSGGLSWYLIDEPTVRHQAPDPKTRNCNGLISYLPGARWIVSDTGPDAERLQHSYLYDTKTRRLVSSVSGTSRAGSRGIGHSPPRSTATGFRGRRQDRSAA